MLEDFKQEFGENFDTCNVFRLGDIILYKDPNVTLQYCVSTQKWDNPNYATLIPKDIPLKMCQRKLYVFRNTYFGSYLNTYQSGDITTNDFNFLFLELYPCCKAGAVDFVVVDFLPFLTNWLIVGT